jgi:enterobactin synthetase component D / holo-[acyl-carrier protein] synthase
VVRGTPERASRDNGGMTLLGSLLPDRIAVEECYHHAARLDLFPEEEAVVARAVDKRRREFATVRRCARRALVRLGRPPVAILPGDRGAPRWPSGVVGSLTHCAGYGAAAVALAVDTVGIGIDAEPHGPLPDGVLASVARPAERARLEELGQGRPDVHWDRLLFSAKESVYKCWFPLTGSWLGFEDAELAVDPVGGTFSARVLAEGSMPDGTALTGFDGRWIVTDGLVVTAVAVPR